MVFFVAAYWQWHMDIWHKSVEKHEGHINSWEYVSRFPDSTSSLPKRKSVALSKLWWNTHAVVPRSMEGEQVDPLEQDADGTSPALTPESCSLNNVTNGKWSGQILAEEETCCFFNDRNSITGQEVFSRQGMCNYFHWGPDTLISKRPPVAKPHDKIQFGNANVSW
jgi:hypothetical protein